MNNIIAIVSKVLRKIFYQHEGRFRWDIVAEPGKTIIDMGCGEMKTAGVIGLDSRPEVNPDIITDLEGKIPLPDNSVDCVYANHFLEHVEKLEEVMSEIYRILKPDGRLRIFVPHFSNPYGYSDYTHKRFFGLFSFGYFCPVVYQKRLRIVPNYSQKISFNITYEKLRFHSPLRIIYPLVICLELVVNSNQLFKTLYEYHFSYLFPIYGIQIELSPLSKSDGTISTDIKTL